MLESTHQLPFLIEDLGMIFPTATSKRKARYGIYKCSCGTNFRASTGSVKNNSTTSCGCMQYKLIGKANTKHGHRYNPLYNVWIAMISRTTNKSHPHFKDYGARGITVCERWLDINNFIEDMYQTYEDGLSIDRIDNNIGYNLSNCRWATKETQAQNTRLICKNNTSGYRGVTFFNRDKKWIAQIAVNSKHIYLGRFDSAIEAARAYDSYVVANSLNHAINRA